MKQTQISNKNVINPKHTNTYMLWMYVYSHMCLYICVCVWKEEILYGISVEDIKRILIF